jgi:hypothetical protein
VTNDHEPKPSNHDVSLHVDRAISTRDARLLRSHNIP